MSNARLVHYLYQDGAAVEPVHHTRPECRALVRRLLIYAGSGNARAGRLYSIAIRIKMEQVLTRCFAFRPRSRICLRCSREMLTVPEARWCCPDERFICMEIERSWFALEVRLENLSLVFITRCCSVVQLVDAQRAGYCMLVFLLLGKRCMMSEPRPITDPF